MRQPVPTPFNAPDTRSELDIQLGGAKAAFDATMEPAAAILSGMVAEPAAGVAGLATGLRNIVDPVGQRAADTVQRVRDALTFQPRSEVGQANLQAIAQSAPIQAIAEGIGAAERFTGLMPAR